MAAVKRLHKILDLLAKRYEVDGKKGELTDLRDPFLVGAWYLLGQHSKRNGQSRAYEALRRAKGLTPGQLLDIAPDKLASICQIAGPYEDARLKNLYAYADQIEEKCGQDFARIFKKSQAEVRKYLENELRKPREFADLLMLHGGFPVFALDLKIARVAARLGYGKLAAEKDYQRAYPEIQKALASEVGKDPEVIIRAHGLLHRLGSELCHGLHPACGECPLQKDCPYAKAHPPVLKTPAFRPLDESARV